MSPRLRSYLVGFACLGAIVLALFLIPIQLNRVESGSIPSSVPATVERDDTPEIHLVPLAAELSASLLQPEGPPEAELDAVGQLLYFYRQAFGENPVGDNGDITAALLGANGKKAAWLPTDSKAVAEGRLVDRWGTPYWFHPVSAKEMELRSAGPDRELFTADDLSLP